ncbi:hypothetical protein BOTBODRAFT_31004 [Botryobasidium botryosum FD-172 SS1]|uniref:RING-type E3 ubiquitin transferase n=1 Tax=Botryobasidium botryosum (strain FD-172 SS1) TaxID=930990 RepID=A0A067ML84_BOTB1|nr:hypothetical protein BOTBODRAFT_31004 [Botryobasidium botryosum FD-172 SS1]
MSSATATTAPVATANGNANNNSSGDRNPRNRNRHRNRKSKDGVPSRNSHVDTPTIKAPQKAEATEPEEEGELCVICAEPVKFYAVSQCNHRVCHVCSLRLRALYKNLDCTLCKEPQKAVIFTVSPTQPFEVYTQESTPFSDAKLCISFETQEMMEETMLLLRYNCPDADCDFVATGWADLKWHVRDKHGGVMCELCIRHKKIFAHEHTLYPPYLLPVHLPSLRRVPPDGDPPNHQTKGKEKSATVDFTHPLCSFCRECFFSNDELYAHLREKHEDCFICKRDGIRDLYFHNYHKLDQHFKNKHHPCQHPTCLEQKFVVFASTIDLQAHEVEVHGESMSGRERKDRRRVETGFTFEDHGRGRGGGHRGGARGDRNDGGEDDSNAHSRHQTSARRAAFGGRLTESDAPRVSNDQEPNHNNNVPSTFDVESISPELAPFVAHLRTLTPALSTSALISITSSFRAYRASETNVRDMLDTISTVLDKDLDRMAGIVNQLVDTLKGESEKEKQSEVLGAWNGIKIQSRGEYPTLAPVGASDSSGYSDIASGRMLNIKRKTAKNASRTSRAVWDRVEQAASSSAPRPAIKPGSLNSFPALSAGASGSGSGSGSGSTPAAAKQSQRVTPWASSSSTALPQASAFPPPSASLQVQAPIKPYSVSSSRSHSPVRGDGRPRAPPTSSTKAFPGLPTRQVAGPPREFIGGNQSLKNIIGSTGAPSASAWGASGREESFGGEEASNSGSGAGGSGSHGGQGKGKKKKGKETLFTLGAFPS